MNMPVIAEFYFTAIVPIAVCALFIILYWVTVNSEFLKEFLYGERPTEPEEFTYFLFTKYAGVIILGIIPVFVFKKLLPHYSLSDYGLSFSNGANPISFYWILMLGPIIIMANWFVARSRKTPSLCQEIILKKWDAKRIGACSIAFGLYLLAFEFLFRGFLFFPQVNSMGVIPAISINILIYTISQTPKGVNETNWAASLQPGALYRNLSNRNYLGGLHCASAEHLVQ